MKLKIRTTLIAGAIATLLAGPVSAASDTPKDGAYAPAPTKAEMGHPERDRPTAGQADVTPQMGGADHGATARSGDAAAIDKPTGISNAAERSAAGSMAAGSRTTAGTSVGDNPLYSRSADDLDGVEVVDSTGDKIGDVKQIVLAPDRKSALAVISAGGFLGMGARDIMVSLDELKPMDDKLQLNVTKAEIASLKDAEPDADKYAEVKGDTPISGSIVEFSAFEKEKEAVKPGTASMTPKTDADKPATAPETPKVPQ